MAKVKYDVSDVESSPDFDTPIPKGVYPCRISDITQGVSKASVERGSPEDMLTVEYEVIKNGDFKGRKLWDYIVLNEASAWKLKQLVEGLGKKAKGTLDTDAAVGTKVLVRVKHETDDRDPSDIQTRARVGSVAPVPEDEDEEEDEEEPEDEDEDEDEDADEDVDDDEDEDEEDLTYEDVMGMNKTDLKELNEDEELGLRISAKTKLPALRQRVVDKLGLEEEEEDDDEDEADEVEVPESVEEVEELDREEMEALVEQEDLDVKFRKNTSDDVLASRIAEALDLEEEEDEDEEDDDEEEEESYDEMSLTDLRTELKSRGLSTKGKKPTLVKRLEKDDGDDGEPF